MDGGTDRKATCHVPTSPLTQRQLYVLWLRSCLASPQNGELYRDVEVLDISVIFGGWRSNSSNLRKVFIGDWLEDHLIADWHVEKPDMRLPRGYVTLLVRRSRLLFKLSPSATICGCLTQ